MTGSSGTMVEGAMHRTRMEAGAAFRRRVRAGEVLLGMFLQTGSLAAAEVAADAGFDWALVDLEHGAFSEAHVAEPLRAMHGSSTIPLVRVESGDRLRIGRALDAGALGVMIPRIDTVEQATSAVAGLRYPPAGTRGVALGTRSGSYGLMTHEEIAPAGQAILGIIQVESALAVRNAAAMASIDGVDVLFVGPGDLTHDLGIPGQTSHPRYQEALATVVAAASACGKASGILLATPELVQQHVELGMTFIGVGSDGGVLNQGIRGMARRARELGGLREAA